MRLMIAIPEANVKKPVLDGALEAVTRLNEDLIRSGASPTSDQLISAGAKWEPEPPGQEHFDHGALIAKRGKGDCDDWAPLHAATLRVTGEDPEAMAVVRKSGPKRWHAVVQRSDGSIDDPSLAAGMPGAGQAWGVHGAVLPKMFEGMQTNVSGTFIATPHLALRPVADRHGQVEAWQARTDLPWHWHPGNSPNDVAMASLHQSPVSSQAIVGAVRGAFNVGLSNDADPETLRRLSAIADACEGYPWEELAARYGTEHADAAGAVVGSFFGKAFKALKAAANPFDLARKGIKLVSPKAARAFGAITPTTANILKYGPKAAGFIPGIGPAAAAALKMASPLLKKSIAKEQHVPPTQRTPGAPGAVSPGFGLVQNFYGYAPGAAGWNQGAPARAPGVAWPPRS